MGTKDEKITQIRERQRKVLEEVSKPGGATGQEMAEKFGTTRSRILHDISELRKMGHPIQISSRRKENGITVAVYEMPRYRSIST